MESEEKPMPAVEQETITKMKKKKVITQDARAALMRALAEEACNANDAAMRRLSKS